MIVQFIFASLSALGFAYIFNVRGKIAWAAATVGGAGWIIYLISVKLGVSLGFSFFIIGAAATIGSEMIARIFKTPVTSALIPIITPIVPGSGAYYTMFYLFNGQSELATQKAIDTFIMTGAMILGFLVASDIFKLYTKYKIRKLKRKQKENL